MSKLKKVVWHDIGWERGEPVPDAGNQGHTFYARKVSDPENVFNYVLKTPRRQDDKNRRALFCAEISAMEVLDHPGIVTIEQTNAKDYKEPIELFLITPKIHGTDLGQLVRKAPLSVVDAVSLTLKILEILGHCHQRGVVHRDIKPCHVILRDDRLDSPMLIDFGLAYHEETQPSDAATKSDEGRGNRFLVGPEHLPPHLIANRNPVTDICQCVGLLYYSITGRIPGSLRDDAGLKPHQRISLKDQQPELVSWKLDALSLLFDTAFEWEPIRRWQAIEPLRESLRYLLQELEPIQDLFRSRLKRLMGYAENESRTGNILRFQPEGAKVLGLIQSIIEVAKSESKEFVKVKSTGGTMEGKRGEIVASFRNLIDASQSRAVVFQIEGNDRGELVVRLKPYTGNLVIFDNNSAILLVKTTTSFYEYQHVLAEWLTELVGEILRQVIGIEAQFNEGARSRKTIS
ncbi:MAG: protein kinase [Pirellulaceae bacterium]